MSVEQKIEELKTKKKLESMKNIGRQMVKEVDEEKYRKMAGKTYKPGECLPAEIQKLKYKDKVAIVGFAPSWTDTPWDDESFDIWSINEMYMQMKMKYGKERRYTHWWEIHNPKSPSKQSPAHQKWIRECKVPIFMQKHYDYIPSSVPIPKDDIINFYNQNFVINNIGASFTEYSNQIAVMTATAVAMGYKEVHIYGVDMAQQSEYAWQRSSCEFFIGYAAGLGCKVLIPIRSELCKYPNFYGFNTDNYSRMYAKSRINTIKDIRKQVETQVLAEQYERDRQKKLVKKEVERIDEGLQRIDDSLIKLELTINNADDMLKFINSMPADVKTLNVKKQGVLNQITEQNKKSKETIESLGKQKQELLKKKMDIERIDFVNNEMFERSQKNLKMSLVGYEGIVAENNHFLNNNII